MGRPSVSLAERFEKKVSRIDGLGPYGDCHEWTGHTGKQGYGQINLGAQHNCKIETTHRVAWFLETGKWPSENVLHSCDNPSCVRFDHLFVGTDMDNTADMISKGRKVQLRGSQCTYAKLTEDQALAIRESPLPGVELANLYGVSPSTISRIRHKTRWQHA